MRDLKIEDLPLEGIRAVVFDVDGTLYDKRHLAFWLIVCDLPHVLYLAAERVCRRQLSGRCFGSEASFYDVLFSRIARYLPVSKQKVERWYFQNYMPGMVSIIAKRYTVGSFLAPLLEELHKRGLRVAVFSDYCYVDEKLSALGVDPESFDYRFCSAQFGGLKPARDVFAGVLQEMSVKPEEALMIGDKESTDGAGAASVGMRFVLAK